MHLIQLASLRSGWEDGGVNTTPSCHESPTGIMNWPLGWRRDTGEKEIVHTAIHQLQYTFPHLHTSWLGDYPEGKSKHLTMHRKTVLSKASRIGDLSSSRTPKSILLTDVGFLALGATNTTYSRIEPRAASLYNEIFELSCEPLLNWIIIIFISHW
jgi:hypothetical protein